MGRSTVKKPIHIGNCAGFYGDRISAARELIDGGPLDVLTGDWLAELTMGILAKAKARGRPGFATTFVQQMRDVLPDCLARGIKVVSNAGGLDPAACAQAIDGLGTGATIAVVEGDTVLGLVGQLPFTNLDTDEIFVEELGRPIAANAYLGGWPIAEALNRGADVVITGRVTDAALVVGPAAWHHGWKRDDWDSLAGAVAAGHVIECGPQCLGGNYSFFGRIPGLEHLGYPIAEIASDGSAVITKHPAAGGTATIGTVTAQLLYELTSPAYANPDVTARFDAIRLTQVSPDRVLISETKGEPPPRTAKVSLIFHGGYRNEMTLGICGLKIREKAALVQRQLWTLVDKGTFDEVDVKLHGAGLGASDPTANEDAMAYLTITVTSSDPERAGREFSNAITSLSLASYPGLFTTTPPKPARELEIYWPVSIDSRLLEPTVTIRSDRAVVPPTPFDGWERAVPSAPPVRSRAEFGPTTRVPLGTVVGSRSGDKGGTANVGLWASSDEEAAWLIDYFSVDQVRALLPEADHCDVSVFPLPNIRAVNIVIKGLLGRGVSSSTRLDPQAKSLGEWLRAKVVDMPIQFMQPTHDQAEGASETTPATPDRSA